MVLAIILQMDGPSVELFSNIVRNLRDPSPAGSLPHLGLRRALHVLT